MIARPSLCFAEESHPTARPKIWHQYLSGILHRNERDGNGRIGEPANANLSGKWVRTDARTNRLA